MRQQAVGCIGWLRPPVFRFAKPTRQRLADRTFRNFPERMVGVFGEPHQHQRASMEIKVRFHGVRVINGVAVEVSSNELVTPDAKAIRHMELVTPDAQVPRIFSLGPIPIETVH